MPPKSRKKRSDDENPPTATWKYVAFLVLLCGGGLQVCLPLFDAFFDAFSVAGFTELTPDSPELSSVFFSGDPWIVLCKNKTDTPAKVWHWTQKALQNDADAQGIRLATFPCHLPLKRSNKTVYEKFGLKPPPTNVYVPKPAPHAFFVANGRKPVMVPQNFFSYPNPDSQLGEKLLKHVKKATRKSVGLVSSTNDLSSKCLKQSTHGCVVLLHAGKLTEGDGSTIARLMAQHRLATFVRVDTAKRRFSLQKDYKLPPVDGKGNSAIRLVFLRKVGGKGKEKPAHGQTKGWKAQVSTAEFSYYNANAFLAKYTAKDAMETEGEGMLVLTKAPQVMRKGTGGGARTKAKKTEEEPKPKPSKEATPKQPKEAKKAKAKDTKEAKKAKAKDTKGNAEDKANKEKQQSQRRRAQMEQEAKDSYSYVEQNDGGGGGDDDDYLSRRAREDVDVDEDEIVELDDEGDEEDLVEEAQDEEEETEETEEMEEMEEMEEEI